MSHGSAGASRRAAIPLLALAALAIFYLRSLGHPSLWLDEAWEANYYLGIVPEPWYNRPVLYMAGVRFVARLLGPGELALRLLPCLAGLATVAATWALVRRTLGTACAWLAASLLAIAPTFILEAHQLKHYTFDALFTVLLMLAYLRYRDDPTHRKLAELTLTGIVSFGFSFTSIFVLAAIGMAHVAHVAIARRAGERLAPPPSRSTSGVRGPEKAPGDGSPRDPRAPVHGSGMTDFAWFLVANVLLVAAFAVVYMTFHANAQGDKLLKDYFVEAWAPLWTPLALPGWFVRQTRVLGEIVGASSFVACALLLAAGAWREFTTGTPVPAHPGSAAAAAKGTIGTPSSSIGEQDARGLASPRARLPVLTTVVVASLVAILMASALHLYPYGSARLMVFLAPLVCALAAAGMLEALGAGGAAKQGAWRVMAVTGLLYVLMYPALSNSRIYLSHGWGTDELGRSVAALARAHAPGQGIYVPERAASSFVYYWWRAGKHVSNPEGREEVSGETGARTSGNEPSGVIWGERHRLHPRDHAAQIARIADTYPMVWVIFDDQSREERETLRGFLLGRYESVRREGSRESESVELFKRRE